jgi:hypothetical protein
VDPTAEEALVPPMVLQPLVENAVYHGIEPGIAAGLIEVRIERRNDRLWLQLTNPYHPDYQHRQGNHMALSNIRERLQLHFDVEASLNSVARLTACFVAGWCFISVVEPDGSLRQLEAAHADDSAPDLERELRRHCLFGGPAAGNRRPLLDHPEIVQPLTKNGAAGPPMASNTPIYCASEAMAL